MTRACSSPFSHPCWLFSFQTPSASALPLSLLRLRQKALLRHALIFLPVVVAHANGPRRLS